MAVDTYNERSLAVKGRNAYGHAQCVPAKAQQLRCDFIGLQENRRPGKNRVFRSRIPGFLLWARKRWQARTKRSWLSNEGNVMP